MLKVGIRLKTKFSIFGSSAQFHRYPLEDVLKDDNVDYIDSLLNSKSFTHRLVGRLIREKQFYRLAKWLLKLFVYPKTKKMLLSVDRFQQVFIYYPQHFYLIEYGFIDYVKRHSMDVKHVVYFSDVRLFLKDKIKILEHYNTIVDAYYIYDKALSVQYGIEYQPLFFSSLEAIKYDDVHYDVVYIGRAKDNLSLIHEIYRYFKTSGISVYFYLVGEIEDAMKIQSNDIVYGDGINYDQYLKKLSFSRCILEVGRTEKRISTLRVFESLQLNKRLITNVDHIANQPYYDEKRMRLFHQAEDIDIDFVRSNEPLKPIKESHLYSPRHFLKAIETKLFKQ